MSDIAKQIGKNIRNIRKNMGMSQEELALKADMHPSHMGQIERGEKSPTIDTLEKIVQALGITFEALFNFSDPKKDFDITKNDQRNIINMIVHKLEGRCIEEQETAFKILKLFFSWKDK